MKCAFLWQMVSVSFSFLCVSTLPTISEHSNISVLSILSRTITEEHPNRVPKVRIIGGQNAYLGQFPYQVFISFRSISKRSQMQCGGSLISHQHVLTAGHCAVDINLSGSVVYVGIIDRIVQTGAVSSRIARITIHPDYDPNEDSNPAQTDDIAVLTLESAIPYSTSIQSISLPAEDSKLIENSGSGWTSGWGAYNKGTTITTTPSQFLQYVQIPFVEHGKCATIWENIPFDYGGGFQLSDRQICAGNYGEGTAQGDSGGPLTIRDQNGKWKQVGIISFGVNFGPLYYDQSSAPGIFTRVQSYCDFIHTASDGQAKCSRIELQYSITIGLMILWLTNLL